eukprot:TRINITY_DN51179_c0_g1_i1.p1 TRINITY_DN51179_c0_g1~~TRINITY_DN51179_c0_g1_i1.p1  ORF type:complete len:516 (+),score=98.81 TRINITY_DN51179_c0_g1_i1:90-1637(+)
MVSQGAGGNQGHSGAALYKIRDQHQAYREAAMAESLAYVAARSKPIVPPNVFVDGSASAAQPGVKPLVRHVIVKDLRKVADRSKVDFPTTGLFENKSPIGLYAIFDGQSAASEPGPMAAEFCARNFHTKVIANIASLPQNCTSDTFVKAALVKSFEDLDKELLETQPDIKDGCGAAIALLMGDTLFTAVLGLCHGILNEVGEAQVKTLGKGQGRPDLQEERSRLQRVGATVVGTGPTSRVRAPDGRLSAVTRAMGDASWKQGGTPVISCIPEIKSVKLSWAEKHTFLLLNSRAIPEALSDQEMVDIAVSFPNQPRAATGEINAKASERLSSAAPTAQCTSVKLCFLPGGPFGQEGQVEAKEEGPAKKKAKIGTDSMGSARLRHILVKFQDATTPAKAQDGKKGAPRSRNEAEALLRSVMVELSEEMAEIKKKFKGKKPEELILKSVKFTQLCKKHSECPSGQKPGNMCGDLGWIAKDVQVARGGNFREMVAPLRPGDFSDIVVSKEGLHLLQRIA